MGESELDRLAILTDPLCLDLVQEYCQLAVKPRLSESESQRLGELLTQAETDGRLDFWIHEADHFIDHALGFGSADRVYTLANENLKARLRELLDLSAKSQTDPNDESGALLEELAESLAAGTRQVQQQLSCHSYYPGPVDGVAGPKTQQARPEFEPPKSSSPDFGQELGG